jgi:hypothetical protein
MNEWKYAQADPSEALAKLHFFSMKKKSASGEIEVRITVKEYISADLGDLTFYAEADQELNQKTAPFRPCGWSNTLLGALSECMRNIRRFEYEELESRAAGASD